MVSIATDWFNDKVTAIKNFFQVNEIKKKVEGDSTFYKVSLPNKRLVPITEIIFKDDEYEKTVDDLVIKTFNNFVKLEKGLELVESNRRYRIRKGKKIILKYFKMSKHHYVVINGSAFEIDTYPKLLLALEFLANFY